MTTVPYSGHIKVSRFSIRLFISALGSFVFNLSLVRYGIVVMSFNLFVSRIG